MVSLLEQQTAINNKLSQRFIALDPSGYFIIYVDASTSLIHVKHFTNAINDQGLAVDPETGEPFPCGVKMERQPTATFVAKTAKELCIEIFETLETPIVTKLDHAAYLGREFMRAEMALAMGQGYVQD